MSKTSQFGDTAIDDCESERIKKIIALASEGDEGRVLSGYGSGRLGLPTPGCWSTCSACLMPPRWAWQLELTGDVTVLRNQKDLWSALGVRRAGSWRSVRECEETVSSGFSVAPLLATYLDLLQLSLLAAAAKR